MKDYETVQDQIEVNERIAQRRALVTAQCNGRIVHLEFEASDEYRFQKAASEVIDRNAVLGNLKGQTFTKITTLTGCLFVPQPATSNHTL